MGIIVALLILWVVLAFVGVAVKGLLWLTVLAVLALLITGAWGFLGGNRRL